MQSLQDSPGAPSTGHAQSQQVDSLRCELDDLKAELVMKGRSLAASEEEVSRLEDTLCEEEKEREQLREDAMAWKNKLNVSEVRLCIWIVKYRDRVVGGGGGGGRRERGYFYWH